jgi:hypothetical protein
MRMRKTATTGLVGIFSVLLSIPGCGGGDSGEPVPECQRYEAAVSTCFHRPASGLATQVALIPHTKAERDRIRQQCNENLARLESACR